MQCGDNRALTSHQCCPGSNPGVDAYTTSCYREKLKKQMEYVDKDFYPLLMTVCPPSLIWFFLLWAAAWNHEHQNNKSK